MKVAISQSNYIPWRGYFDMINRVDQFVIYDEMQYTKNDWRNRNKIKTNQGLKWLTIPIVVKGKYFQKISDAKVVDNRWIEKHWKTIELTYKKAANFDLVRDWLKEIYFSQDSPWLSEINEVFIREINTYLGIDTEILSSKDLALTGNSTEKLVNICTQLGADQYLTGPSAKNYLKLDCFHDAGIEVLFMKYDNYKNYTQIHGSFAPEVSIIDLLFNEGINSKNYI